MSATESPITFKDFDCLDLEGFSQRLERFIDVEHDFVDGSLVISLDAGFGSGKTTFIEMWKNSLIERREKGEFLPMPIVLNAWESDHCGDPMLAILSEMMTALDEWHGKDKPDPSSFKSALKDIGRFALGVGNEIVSKQIGVDFAKVGEGVEKKKQSTVPSDSEDIISLYKKRATALKNLKESIAGTFGGSNSKVYIFVDELDRCRPDYAVSYLETIKHIFDTPGIVFILTVDTKHLENSVKKLYGDDLNFPEYFRKFSHRTITLPTITEISYNKIISKYIDHYITKNKQINSQTKSNLKSQIRTLSNSLHVNPRQLKEIFRHISHSLQRHNIEGESSAIHITCIILCHIKITDQAFFKKLFENSTQFQTATELIKYLKSKINHNNFRIFFRYIASSIDRTELTEHAQNEINRILGEVTEESNPQSNSPMRAAWEFNDTNIKKIITSLVYAEQL